MKIFRKILCLSIAAILCAAVFAGCGKQGKESGSGTKTDKGEEEVKVSAEPIYTMLADSLITSAKSAADDEFKAANVTMRENSPLKGKTFYWLGSSVTYGSSSGGESMADYLAALTGCVCVKEAVSGTTIYDDGGSGNSGARSYTRRLQNTTAFDKNAEIDAFICQISTNDCTNDRLVRRGTITGEYVLDKEEFDLSTTLGGIEFIIAYVTETWRCPVYFYSGAYFGDGPSGTKRQNNNPKGSEYGKLVSQVRSIADKWNLYMDFDVKIIDLYGDENFNAAASDKFYSWATSDPIHPKNAGYLQWWTPYFESFLINNL